MSDCIAWPVFEYKTQSSVPGLLKIFDMKITYSLLLETNYILKQRSYLGYQGAKEACRLVLFDLPSDFLNIN